MQTSTIFFYIFGKYEFGWKKDGKCRVIIMARKEKKTMSQKTCKADAQRGHSYQS